MVFVLDNYDSFTYNLVQYLGEMGAEVVARRNRSEEHTSELQSLRHLVCRLLLISHTSTLSLHDALPISRSIRISPIVRQPELFLSVRIRGPLSYDLMRANGLCARQLRLVHLQPRPISR